MGLVCDDKCVELLIILDAKELIFLSLRDQEQLLHLFLLSHLGLLLLLLEFLLLQALPLEQFLLFLEPRQPGVVPVMEFAILRRVDRDDEQGRWRLGLVVGDDGERGSCFAEGVAARLLLLSVSVAVRVEVLRQAGRLEDVADDRLCGWLEKARSLSGGGVALRHDLLIRLVAADSAGDCVNHCRSCTFQVCLVLDLWRI